jgi:hypothetical protein
MTCASGEVVAPDLVEALFRRLDAAGLERLHEIERDIVAHLRERPVTTWCRVHLQMLTELTEKAEGNLFPRKTYVRD